MHVVLHDYSGHPFPAQLSRELARRGHRVTHLWCSSYSSGKGALTKTDADPSSWEPEVIVSEEVARQASFRRVGQERAYGRAAAKRVLELEPDVVLSGNTPLFAQQVLLAACRRASVPFVFWQQDVYSEGMRHGAEEKFGRLLGGTLGRVFMALEAGELRRSDAVVAISEDFKPQLARFRVRDERIHIVENWGPVDELPMRPRANTWGADHGLVDKRVALYAGTLGLKHNPELVLEVARRAAAEPDVEVVVVSEGSGARWLEEQARAEKLDTLTVLPFQSYERLPDTLGSADVLLAILEPDAGVYSVPSKILSYHCAGRAIVAALPAENLAARTIERAASGVVVDSTDASAYADAVMRLLSDATERQRLGTNARAYAERAFAIGPVAERFEGILRSAVNGHELRRR